MRRTRRNLLKAIFINIFCLVSTRRFFSLVFLFFTWVRKVGLRTCLLGFCSHFSSTTKKFFSVKFFLETPSSVFHAFQNLEPVFAPLLLLVSDLGVFCFAFWLLWVWFFWVFLLRFPLLRKLVSFFFSLSGYDFHLYPPRELCILCPGSRWKHKWTKNFHSLPL